MSHPSTGIFEASAVRAAEARYVAAGFSLGDLMERAGRAACRVLNASFPEARRVLVLVGPGNNGGDGYVLARLLKASGTDVRVVAPVPPAGELARRAAAAWGGPVSAYAPAELEAADVVVDALFGIGLARDLEAPFLAIIDTLNAGSRPVLSLDVPSGLDADRGAERPRAVRATVTSTFLVAKPGLYLGAGPDCAGRIEVDSLGLDGAPFASLEPALVRLDETDLRSALGVRPRQSHKGMNGHVVVVAGGPGMGGAARLVGVAALRSGAGLVSLLVHESSLGVAASVPELLTQAAVAGPEFAAALARADVIAIGPGLGQSAWAADLLAAALAAGKPLILDADALNLLAGGVPAPVAGSGLPPSVLTPHPGEAARLLGISTVAVGEDRLGAIARLSARYRAAVVLKGAASLVACPGAPTAVCTAGNPGMASAGMGDVLTGVIAGIAAQQPDLADASQFALDRAARAGVLAHARAGDLAALAGERGLLASDLIAALPRIVNPLGRRPP